MTIDEINVNISELEEALAQAEENLAKLQAEQELAKERKEMRQEFYEYAIDTLKNQKDILECYKTEFANPSEYDSYDGCTSTIKNVQTTISIIAGCEAEWWEDELDLGKAQKIYGFMGDIVSLGGAACEVEGAIFGWSDDEIKKQTDKYKNSGSYLTAAGHLVGVFANAQNIINDPEHFDYESAKGFTDDLISLGEDLTKFATGESFLGDYGDQITGFIDAGWNILNACDHFKRADTHTVAGSLEYVRGMSCVFRGVCDAAKDFGGPIGELITYPVSIAADILDSSLPVVAKGKEHNIAIEYLEYGIWGDGFCVEVYTLYTEGKIDVDTMVAAIDMHNAGEWSYLNDLRGDELNDALHNIGNPAYIPTPPKDPNKGELFIGTEEGEPLYGTPKNDIIYGYAGDDNLFGREGSDEIHGGEGDDYIHGGSGSDYLAGDDGNDRYAFFIGNGIDTIYDRGYNSSTNDCIEFGGGVTPQNIQVDRIGDHLYIKYSDEDAVIVKDAYFWQHSDGRNFVENIKFSDGTVWNAEKINKEAAIRHGTDESDYLEGYASASGYDDDEELHGLGGNDRLRGNSGNDKLYGGE